MKNPQTNFFRKKSAVYGWISNSLPNPGNVVTNKV